MKTDVPTSHHNFDRYGEPTEEGKRLFWKQVDYQLKLFDREEIELKASDESTKNQRT